MIKFFRHIRKSLLEQNKMGKYFKYAIGEIVLVVIGILIALQVNNWNEQRLAKNQARAYLKNLNTEINQNILVFEGMGKHIKRLANISHYYHTKLFDSSAEVHDSVINNFIIKINPINAFDPSQTVLKDFLASGYLKDIKNDTLKNNILFLFLPFSHQRSGLIKKGGICSPLRENYSPLREYYSPLREYYSSFFTTVRGIYSENMFHFYSHVDTV